MEFRIMTPEDIPACARTLMAAFVQPPWNEHWTHEQAVTRIDEIMSGRMSRGYVAVEGETVVSMLLSLIHI